MNLVIIEDERLFADDLAENITAIWDEPVSITNLYSVQEAIAYFTNHPAPDLIFSDIQLGDGLSFEIFATVPMTVPVIFCTAYDEYAIRAFKANGIDYILKPFTAEMLENALTRYRQFKQAFSVQQAPSYDKLMQLLLSKEQSFNTTSILVYFKDKIIPVKLEDVALIYLENDLTHLLTFNGKVHYPNKNLDEIEKTAGNHFFRANRQVLICRKAIIDVSSFFTRKLALNITVPYKETITISKAKTPAFLEWLATA